MTIDQLIAELHKRREVLVRKGYPEAQIKLEIVAAPDGRQFWASFYTGKVGPYGSIHSHYERDSIGRKLSEIDAVVVDVPEKVTAEACAALFDMAQLAERV